MKRSWNGAAREHDLPVCGLGIATPSVSEPSVRGVDLVVAMVTPMSARLPLVRPPALQPGETVALLKPSRPRRPADISSWSGGVPNPDHGRRLGPGSPAGLRALRGAVFSQAQARILSQTAAWTR
jgi:hypothetical protein